MNRLKNILILLIVFIFSICLFPKFTNAVNVSSELKNNKTTEKLIKIEKNQEVLVKQFDNLQKKIDRQTFIFTALLSAIFTLIGILIVFTYWSKKRNF